MIALFFWLIRNISIIYSKDLLCIKRPLNYLSQGDFFGWISLTYTFSSRQNSCNFRSIIFITKGGKAKCQKRNICISQELFIMDYKMNFNIWTSHLYMQKYNEKLFISIGEFFYFLNIEQTAFRNIEHLISIIHSFLNLKGFKKHFSKFEVDMQILCMRYNIMLQIPSAISSFDLLSIANRFLLAIDLKRVSGNHFDTNWILQENIFPHSFQEHFSWFIQKRLNSLPLQMMMKTLT